MTGRVCGACSSTPTRDDVYVCDTCADLLADVLTNMGWLEDQLTTSLTKQKGMDYRRAGSGGGKPAEGPLPLNLSASAALTVLRSALVDAVRYCIAHDVRHSSPDDELPGKSLASLGDWLRWRVDGLVLHDVPQLVTGITAAADRGLRTVDRRADRQYLGGCTVKGCGGSLYAIAGAPFARCDTCGDSMDAGYLRDRLLGELDDRLCTASEIARLCMYLGLRRDRVQVRKRVNVWHHRGRIVSEAALGDEPAFRFGIVWRLLMQDEVSA